MSEHTAIEWCDSEAMIRLTFSVGGALLLLFFGQHLQIRATASDDIRGSEWEGQTSCRPHCHGLSVERFVERFDLPINTLESMRGERAQHLYALHGVGGPSRHGLSNSKETTSLVDHATDRDFIEDATGMRNVLVAGFHKVLVPASSIRNGERGKNVWGESRTYSAYEAARVRDGRGGRVGAQQDLINVRLSEHRGDPLIDLENMLKITEQPRPLRHSMRSRAVHRTKVRFNLVSHACSVLGECF